jgi:hypothetical protein
MGAALYASTNLDADIPMTRRAIKKQQMTRRPKQTIRRRKQRNRQTIRWGKQRNRPRRTRRRKTQRNNPVRSLPRISVLILSTIAAVPSGFSLFSAYPVGNECGAHASNPARRRPLTPRLAIWKASSMPQTKMASFWDRALCPRTTSTPTSPSLRGILLWPAKSVISKSGATKPRKRAVPKAEVLTKSEEDTDDFEGVEEKFEAAFNGTYSNFLSDRAPLPANSPLCSRSRYSGSGLDPMYVQRLCLACALALFKMQTENRWSSRRQSAFAFGCRHHWHRLVLQNVRLREPLFVDRAASAFAKMNHGMTSPWGLHVFHLEQSSCLLFTDKCCVREIFCQW